MKNEQNAQILRDICPKSYQNASIFTIFARKINKIPGSYMKFTRKMPEFYMIIAGKIFFLNFFGGRARADSFLSPSRRH